MARITYVGSCDAIDVPDAGIRGLARGESVEVPDALAEGLLEQDTNWKAAKAARRTPAPASLDEE